MSSSTDFTVKIIGDASNAKKVVDQFGDGLGKSASGWGSMFKSAAATAGGVLGALGIENLTQQVMDFGQQSVDAFKEAEESQALLEQAYSKFPAIADVNIAKLRELNTVLQSKTGYDDDQIAASQATLAQFGLTGEQISKLTPLMLDYAAKTGSDLTTAAEAMGKAVLGQGRALKTVGVDFTDTGSAAGNFDQIMSGLSSTVGGTAETLGKTGAGQAKILEATFGDLQESIGEKLLPVITGFQSFLITDLIPAFSGVVDWVSENSDTVLALGGVVGGAAIAYGVLSTAIKLQTAYQAAAAATTGGLTVAQWAWNAALTANPIGIIIMAIAALVAGIIWLATQTTFFQDLWAGVTAVVGAAWEWLWGSVLEPVFTAIGAAFGWIYDNIILPVVTGIMLYIGLWAAAATWLWETVLSPVFEVIGSAFRFIYEGVIAPVVGWIGDQLQLLGLGFSLLWTTFVQPALDGIGAGLQWVYNSIIKPVFDAISTAVTWVGSTIRAAFSGIGDFIGAAFSAALGVVRGPINGIIALVNSAIRGLNSLSVTIPAWVPFVGGQTWGLSIPEIPRLAAGTVTNGPLIAMVGDNPGGREVVAPLDTYLGELRNAAGVGATAAGAGAVVSTPAGPVELGDKTINAIVGGVVDAIRLGSMRVVSTALRR